MATRSWKQCGILAVEFDTGILSWHNSKPLHPHVLFRLPFFKALASYSKVRLTFLKFPCLTFIRSYIFFTKMTPNHSEVTHALVHSFPRQNEVSLAGPFELQKSLQFTFWMLFSFQIYFRIFSRKFCYQNILYQSSKHVLKYESLPQLRSRSVSSTKADCSLISARTARTHRHSVAVWIDYLF